MYLNWIHLVRLHNVWKIFDLKNAEFTRIENQLKSSIWYKQSHYSSASALSLFYHFGLMNSGVALQKVVRGSKRNGYSTMKILRHLSIHRSENSEESLGSDWIWILILLIGNNFIKCGTFFLSHDASNRKENSISIWNVTYLERN